LICININIEGTTLKNEVIWDVLPFLMNLRYPLPTDYHRLLGDINCPEVSGMKLGLFSLDGFI